MKLYSLLYMTLIICGTLTIHCGEVKKHARCMQVSRMGEPFKKQSSLASSVLEQKHKEAFANKNRIIFAQIQKPQTNYTFTR